MWRDLLVALLAAIAGALFAGILGWWGETSARNAERFAAARTLRKDLCRVAEQLQKAIDEDSWVWLVDLSLPSWTQEARAAIAQFSSTEKWKLIEELVFNITLLDQEKKRKLATLAAAEIDLDSEGNVTEFGGQVFLAKAGQLNEPVDETIRATATEVLEDVDKAAEILNWDSVPSPLSRTKLSSSIGSYLRSHIPGLTLVLLTVAVAVGIAVFAATRPTPPTPPTLAARVADSLQSGLAGTTGRFAACEPIREGSTRFLCDVQFQGPTCQTGVLAEVSDSSLPAAARLIAGVKTKAQCFEQIIAEANSRGAKVLAERAHTKERPATEPMDKNSVEVKLAA
jgi:hypothetical protein